MALVIETGQIIAGANSYATVSDLRNYASLRAASVPAADADCEVLLIKAMDALETQDFVGEKVRATQPLKWPRAWVEIECFPIPADEIPLKLIQAQCALAIEAQAVDLLPTLDINSQGPVIEEIVGPVTTIYANPGTVRRVPAIAKADALLKTLIKRNGLRLIRS